MAVTNSTIDMTWTAATDNVGVVSYHIYQSTDNVVYTEIHSTDGATYAYTAIGLNTDTKYYFKQTAKDAAGNESLYGNTVEATTLGGVAPPTTDPDYQAVLDYATGQGITLPSATQQDEQNQFVLDYKLQGVWDEEMVFYFISNDGSREFSTLNVKDPTIHRLVEFGNLQWSSNGGFQSSAKDGWLYCDLDVLDGDSSKLQPADMSSGIYILEGNIGTANAGLYGVGVAPYYHRIYTSANITYNTNAAQSGSVAGGGSDQLGYISILIDNTNLGLNESRLFQRGAQASQANIANPPNPTSGGVGFAIGAVASSSTASSLRGDCRYGFFNLGSNQFDLMAAKNTVIEDYMIAIGVLMSTAQVDALLIDADNNGDSNTTIDLSQSAQPRSTASDTAVANLISRNVTVITN